MWCELEGLERARDREQPKAHSVEDEDRSLDAGHPGGRRRDQAGAAGDPSSRQSENADRWHSADQDITHGPAAETGSRGQHEDSEDVDMGISSCPRPDLNQSPMLTLAEDLRVA